MHTVGRNADLRAEAELGAVGELRAGIVHDDRAVDLGEEALGRRRVVGHDRLGVLAAPARDVADGAADAVDRSDRDDRRQVLGAPVLVGGGQRLGIALLHLAVAAHLAAELVQPGQHRHQMRVERGAIDQQGFGGAADADAAHLGVGHDVARHGDVGVAIDIDVADAVIVAQHRHPAFVGDPVDQRAPAARHDEVEPASRAQQLAHGRAIGGRHELHAILGQAGGLECTAQQLDDGTRGMEAVGAATQHHRIARLDAKRTGVGGNVGSGLVDHADDADRNPHAADHQTVGARPLLDQDPHRVGQGDDIVEPPRHRLDPRFVQQQAVLQRGTHAGKLGGVDVLGVGGQDRDLLAADQAGRFAKRAVLGLGRGIAQVDGGFAGAPAQLRHEGGGIFGRLGLNVHRPLQYSRSRTHSTTRSSRWTISSRPRKPNKCSISALLRPAMRRASSAA